MKTKHARKCTKRAKHCTELANYSNLPYDIRTRGERMELFTLGEKISFGIIIGSLVIFLLGSILENYYGN